MTWEPYDSRGRPNVPRSNPKDFGELEPVLRDRLWTMCEDYDLHPVSLYRDPGRQYDLRLERVGLANIWNNAIKGSPVTAVPARWNPATGEWEGGSKHQHRKAGDIGGARLADARKVCESYGLVDNVPSEAWHYQTGGAPSRPIRSYPGPCYDDPPTPPTPKDWLDMATQAEVKAIIDAALAPIKAEVAELHDQWIGTKDGAPDEALRQLLRRVDAATTALLQKP